MELNSKWNVLTVGDGDLSFSNSLLENNLVLNLTPTVFDSEETINRKYSVNAISELGLKNVAVQFEFDVTNEQHWRQRIHRSYDVVVFQFPLVPAQSSRKDSSLKLSTNVCNRAMLRMYIKLASTLALSADGEGLIYITSKDVKPYIDWNIENLVENIKGIYYLGKSPFDAEKFKGYMMRNVDRDKVIKGTEAATYVWSTRPNHPFKNQLINERNFSDNGCQICKAGPFATEQESNGHLASRRHKRMVEFEQEWLGYLNREVQ